MMLGWSGDAGLQCEMSEKVMETAVLFPETVVLFPETAAENVTFSA